MTSSEVPITIFYPKKAIPADKVVTTGTEKPELPWMIHGIIPRPWLLAMAAAPATTLVYCNGGSLCIAECITGISSIVAIRGKNTVLRRL
jgi:hypothetical protein